MHNKAVCGPEEAFGLDWMNKPLEESAGSFSAVVDLCKIRQKCVKRWIVEPLAPFVHTGLLENHIKHMSFNISTGTDTGVLESNTHLALSFIAASGFHSFYSFLFILVGMDGILFLFEFLCWGGHSLQNRK